MAITEGEMERVIYSTPSRAIAQKCTLCFSLNFMCQNHEHILIVAHLATGIILILKPMELIQDGCKKHRRTRLVGREWGCNQNLGSKRCGIEVR